VLCPITGSNCEDNKSCGEVGVCWKTMGKIEQNRMAKHIVFLPVSRCDVCRHKDVQLHTKPCVDCYSPYDSLRHHWTPD